MSHIPKNTSQISRCTYQTQMLCKRCLNALNWLLASWTKAMPERNDNPRVNQYLRLRSLVLHLQDDMVCIFQVKKHHTLPQWKTDPPTCDWLCRSFIFVGILFLKKQTTLLKSIDFHQGLESADVAASTLGMPAGLLQLGHWRPWELPEVSHWNGHHGVWTDTLRALQFRISNLWKWKLG